MSYNVFNSTNIKIDTDRVNHFLEEPKRRKRKTFENEFLLFINSMRYNIENFQFAPNWEQEYIVDRFIKKGGKIEEVEEAIKSGKKIKVSRE